MIFNFKNFSRTSSAHKHPRKGSEIDVKRLHGTFKGLGFKVKVYEDKSKNEVLKKLKHYRNKTMEKYDIFAMAILTHGDKDGVLFVHDDIMNVADFVNPLKENKSLLQKPKVRVAAWGRPL